MSDAGEGLSYIERGTGEDAVRFLSVPIPYDDAEKVEALLAEIERLRAALKAICTTEDSGAWIEGVYRPAGGGYEGLQAIAAAALDQ